MIIVATFEQTMNKNAEAIINAIKPLDTFSGKLIRADRKMARVMKRAAKAEKGVSRGNIFLRLNKSLEDFLAKDAVFNKLVKRFTYFFGGFKVVQGFSAALISVGEGLEVIKTGLAGFLPEKTFKRMQKVGGFLKKTLGPKGIANFVSSAKSRYQTSGAYALGVGGQEGDFGLSRKDRIGAIMGKYKDKGSERREKIVSVAVGFFKKIKAIKMKDVGTFFGKGWEKFKGKAKSFFGKFAMMSKIIMKSLFMFTLYMTLIATTILLIWPLISGFVKGVYAGIQQTIGVIWSGLELVWEGVSDIFGFLFGDKTFNEMLDGVFKVLGGLALTAIGIIISIAWPLLKGLWEAAKEWGLSIAEWFMSLEWHEIFAVAIGSLIFIVAWLMGFPVLIPALLVVTGFMLVRYAIEKIGKLFSFFADGGVSKGGLAVVGERGPELVNLPKGSRVHSNRESKKMASGMGGNSINVTINAHSLQDTELRRIAQKVGDMINRQVNRGTSSSTVR